MAAEADSKPGPQVADLTKYCQCPPWDVKVPRRQCRKCLKYTIPPGMARWNIGNQKWEPI